MTTAEQKFFAEMIKWCDEEYVKLVNIKGIKDKKVRDFLKGTDLKYWSHKNRFTRNLQMMKAAMASNKTDMISTCFKITFDSTSCIYAYVYSAAEGTSATHQFVCTGPTFRSQDGEYRSRYIPWGQFQALFERYAEEFALVEAIVVGYMVAEMVQFQVDFCYPIGFTYGRDKYEDDINCLRLPIKLYILCWLCDFHAIHTKTMANHINPAYQYIFYQAEDVDVYDALIKKMGLSEYLKMLERITSIFQNINEITQTISPLQCGQKLFPITIFEAAKLDDIHFSTWREIYITNMASNLALNMITPCVPFINNWFYVQNSHAGIYDNIAMHDKYQHSEIAAEVAGRLKAADEYTYVERKRNKGPINSKFARLSRAIQKSIDHADIDLRLTDLSLCVTSEYVGRTFRDVPNLVANRYAKDLIFANPDTFAKHIFEYIYTLASLNTKLQVMHGDLHLNNITIYRLYNMYTEENKIMVENPHMVYVVDDVSYLFPHYGLFSMIIDFSRAIIADEARLVNEFSDRFAEQYFKNQRPRIIAMLYHYFPKTVEKSRAKIEALLLTNLPLMFKVVSSIDAFALAANVTTMVTHDDLFARGVIKAPASSIDLLKRIASAAEHLTITNLQAAIDGRITKPEDIEWPNLRILRQQFESWVLTPAKMAEPGRSIVEVFNSANEVVHDIDDYETWGPLLSFDKELEVGAKYGIPLDDATKHWQAHLDVDESAIIDSLTSKYLDRESTDHVESWMLV